jgi:hypothetical protein
MVTPPLTPFQRLRVSDGLLINADHWQKAHAYSRDRQNFYYQALHQAGIVSGLGVSVVQSAVVQSAAGTSAVEPIVVEPIVEQRQLLIQPGIAIDAQGNPIIVPERMTFQIRSQAQEGTSLLVYLVLNYVDPDDLNLPKGGSYIQERFRIVEKAKLDEKRDVELCRVQLRSGTVRLQMPSDLQGEDPNPHILDFRYRQWADRSPRGMLKVAQLGDGAAEDVARVDRLEQLLQSLDGLYPALQGDRQTPDAPLVSYLLTQALGQLELGRLELSDYDLISCPYDCLLQLDGAGRRALRRALQQGSMVFVSIPVAQLQLAPLLDSVCELRSAILALQHSGDQKAPLRESLLSECAATEAAIHQRIQRIPQDLAELAQALGTPLSGDGQVDRHHPLRHQPFLFGQFPEVDGYPIQLLQWGGLVLSIGDIALNWGLDDRLVIPRETLRSAQEFGINLLQYAWARRQLKQSG